MASLKLAAAFACGTRSPLKWRRWAEVILFILSYLSVAQRRGTDAESQRAGYDFCEMKKEQVARRLARESHVSPAAAADQLDRIVSDLLTRVRRGQAASLPGLGTFQSGSEKEFQFDCEAPQTGRSSKKRSK